MDKVAWFGFRAEARAAENTRIVHWVTERRRSPGRNAFQMSFLWELDRNRMGSESRSARTVRNIHAR
ncbi:MAG: hypothetical protein QOJ51_5904 [Acidobacteriaceae bacterium]|nr:hypothetical protein [Acidobacteriaceae bacterium]MEA2263079.1 hypothetical protein [Acidobacteriaceae bacterium]MEA3005451.1 hypothetical protein [Acidobacteriaceae bacterium]